MHPEYFDLENGIRVYLDAVSTVDSCAIGIWVRAGTRDEPKRGDGVAHFVEHTSFRRTPSRNSTKISRDFENVGAYVNAYTTKEETCYYVRSLRENVNAVVTTLADVVLNPLFLPADVEKERTIITEEIRSYEDEAEEYIFDAAEQQLFGPHPLGVPIVGTVESVRGITAEDVRAFHNKHYHAGSIAVAVSGAFHRKELQQTLEDSLSGAAPRCRLSKRSTPVVRTGVHETIHRPNQQAHLLWQCSIPGYRHEDRYALQILNVVLGDGMSSRLNVKLRETKGLAYSVYSQVQLFADCGCLSVYAGVDERKVSRVDSMVRSVIHNLVSDGIRPGELSRAKMQLRASKLMSLESLTARMTMLGKGAMEHGSPEDPYQTIADFTAVTSEDVLRVAQSYLAQDNWCTFSILPLEEGSK